jgi:SAM-dependent MidA family methyltransferase
MCGKSPGPEEGLGAAIAERIRTSGPMAFSEFMGLALYDPQGGYYASGRAAIGRQGDFFTSVSAGAVFGEVLAGQFLEMQARMGGDFLIVEQGANDGQLAIDVLGALEAAGCTDLSYAIVEPFPALEQKQRETLAGKPVRWFRSLDSLPEFRGVHFSNELFDALPVDLVRSDGTAWHELRVGLGVGGFEWATGAETRCDYPVRPAGYTTEIRRGQEAIFRSLAGKMKAGFLLAVDYGMSREALLAPHRTEGTLSCYRAHRRDADPLEAPGEKDITAHVDFTSLIAAAETEGFSVAGFTDQHHFLVGAAAEMLRAMDGLPPSPESRKKLRSLQTLLHPESMGTQFHVLVLERGLDGPAMLSGLQFARRPA